MSLQPERIAQLCELLKLPAIHAEWSAYAQRAAQEEHSFADFLESVLSASEPPVPSAFARRCSSSRRSRP